MSSSAVKRFMLQSNNRHISFPKILINRFPETINAQVQILITSCKDLFSSTQNWFYASLLHLKIPGSGSKETSTFGV